MVNARTAARGLGMLWNAAISSVSLPRGAHGVYLQYRTGRESEGQERRRGVRGGFLRTSARTAGIASDGSGDFPRRGGFFMRGEKNTKPQCPPSDPPPP